MLILEHYARCIQEEDRIWELIAARALDFTEAGVVVLGEQIAAMFPEELRAKLLAHVHDLLNAGDTGPLSRLVSTTGDDWDNRFEGVCDKFRSLLDGMRSS